MLQDSPFTSPATNPHGSQARPSQSMAAISRSDIQQSQTLSINMRKFVGIDFGTTNSAIALADKAGSVSMARFQLNDQQTENFRSVLYFEQVREGTRKNISAHAGPSAIAHYLEAEQKGRLIQSLKSYLGSRLLTSTNVFGRPYLLEELI